jgi:hypothetical protein
VPGSAEPQTLLLKPADFVPADDKPSARAMVVEAVVDLLEGLDLSTPSAGEAKRRELEEGRRRLDAEG